MRKKNITVSVLSVFLLTYSTAFSFSWVELARSPQDHEIGYMKIDRIDEDNLRAYYWLKILYKNPNLKERLIIDGQKVAYSVMYNVSDCKSGRTTMLKYALYGGRHQILESDEPSVEMNTHSPDSFGQVSRDSACDIVYSAKHASETIDISELDLSRWSKVYSKSDISLYVDNQTIQKCSPYDNCFIFWTRVEEDEAVYNPTQHKVECAARLMDGEVIPPDSTQEHTYKALCQNNSSLAKMAVNMPVQSSPLSPEEQSTKQHNELLQQQIRQSQQSAQNQLNDIRRQNQIYQGVNMLQQVIPLFRGY